MEKIKQTFATPEEAVAEGDRRAANVDKDVERRANRTPSLDELWTLLKDKGLIVQGDLS